MLFVVDPHSGVPIFRQLMEQAKLAVAGGRLAPIELVDLRIHGEAFPLTEPLIAAIRDRFGPEVIGPEGVRRPALAAELFTVDLMSGARWSFTAHDAFMAGGVLILYFEIFKSTRTGVASVLDHTLSTLVFIVFLVEFLVVEACGTSTFFVLGLMALLDVIAGFTVSIGAARREFGDHVQRGHQGQRLFFAVFAPPQALHGGLVCGIHGQVETAQPLDGGDAAGRESAAAVSDTIRLDNVPTVGCYSHAADKYYCGAVDRLVVVDGAGDTIVATIEMLFPRLIADQVRRV